VRTHREFLARRDTARPFVDDRLQLFVEAYRRHRREAARPLSVLDVACGRRAVLSKAVEPGDRYLGCDFHDAAGAEIDYVQVDLNSESLAKRLCGGSFDVVFCGEILEHLFSPDALVDDLKQLMAPGAILIVSTPNLGYYANRVLLLFGVSPLYLENSAEMKLGRKLRALGQGRETEGHVRLFTYGAMVDLLRLKELEIVDVTPTITWNFPLDRLVCRLSRSLAPNNVFTVRKRVAA
jgi:SAM-dependent methyltransferase